MQMNTLKILYTFADCLSDCKLKILVCVATELILLNSLFTVFY